MLNKLDNPFERCEFKFAGMQDGQFTAYASVFGGIDAYKDTIHAGAFEDSLKEMPFFIPINLKMGVKIKRNNKYDSTPINNQKSNVLAVGFNHKKYSKNSVKNKYKNPRERNKIPPLINSFV